MADQKTETKPETEKQAEADREFVEKAKTVVVGRGKSKETQPSYSLYDAASGKKILSGVPRADAAAEKTRRKNLERTDSRLQAD